MTNGTGEEPTVSATVKRRAKANEELKKQFEVMRSLQQAQY